MYFPECLCERGLSKASPVKPPQAGSALVFFLNHSSSAQRIVNVAAEISSHPYAAVPFVLIFDYDSDAAEFVLQHGFESDVPCTQSSRRLFISGLVPLFCKQPLREALHPPFSLQAARTQLSTAEDPSLQRERPLH